MPRDVAIAGCLDWARTRDDGAILVGYPEGDESRLAEARILERSGAEILEIVAPENIGRSVDELIENGAVGDTTVVLLLGEYGPQIVQPLRGRSPDVAIVTEALFEASVDRMRDSGVGIDGAIVLDLVGTLDTVDNYDNGEDSDIYLSSIFYR